MLINNIINNTNKIIVHEYYSGNKINCRCLEIKEIAKCKISKFDMW